MLTIKKHKNIKHRGVCFMVVKIIPRNMEVTNIDSYVCYKVRKLIRRYKAFPGIK
jgi:hypothetical protein